MTRVIAGRHGGRSLQAPRGVGTRPTSDRVREALFSALAARGAISGAQVLDLYAGSGALGIEALSRGAASATLVEADRRAAGVVRGNLTALGERDGTVIAQAVRTFLAGSAPRAMDLVFLDPPYDLSDDDLAGDLATLVDRGWLGEGALVVVERSSRSPEPTWPEGLHLVSEKRYGETALWLAAC
jgi:16S rRNA (guanine966-N2)-methyltransferase